MLSSIILNALLKIITILNHKTVSSCVAFTHLQLKAVPSKTAPLNSLIPVAHQYKSQMIRLEPIPYLGSHLHETNSHQCNPKRRTTRRNGQRAEALRSRYRSSLS